MVVFNGILSCRWYFSKREEKKSNTILSPMNVCNVYHICSMRIPHVWQYVWWPYTFAGWLSAYDARILSKVIKICPSSENNIENDLWARSVDRNACLCSFYLAIRVSCHFHYIKPPFSRFIIAKCQASFFILLIFFSTAEFYEWNYFVNHNITGCIFFRTYIIKSLYMGEHKKSGMLNIQ